MERVSPEVIRSFRVLNEAELRVLGFADRLAYLKVAIQVRKVINRQVEETLFGIPEGR
jgi:hypothetical protein